MKLSCLLVGLFSMLWPVFAYAEDPRANSLVEIFTQACLRNVGNPDAVYAWASEKKLSPITNPEGQKVFIGDGNGGAAWNFRIANINAVLSIRSQAQTCAIYGEAADVSELHRWFDVIVGVSIGVGVKATTLKDDDQVGEFGHRIGKVILLKPFEKPPTERILALITNERPGGAYQVTMQITGLQPKL
jgi:hypothetical protein